MKRRTPRWVLVVALILLVAVALWGITYYTNAVNPAAGALGNAVRDLDLTLTPR